VPPVYCLVKNRYAEAAFSGEGARLYGGRWNSRGRRVIYTADSIALAALELLIHLQSEPVLAAYRLFRLDLAADQIMYLATTDLPDDWQHEPAPPATARIGDEWLDRGLSLALQVPSVIVPEERNFLLNPAHPDYLTVVQRAWSRLLK
jgi:RES domain-containing protein